MIHASTMSHSLITTLGRIIRFRTIAFGKLSARDAKINSNEFFRCASSLRHFMSF